MDIVAEPGELTFTVTIKRKDTGKEETYELVGQVTKEQAEQLLKEKQDGSHS